MRVGAFDKVQVAVAQPTGRGADKHLMRPGVGNVHLLDLKRFARFDQDGCFHRATPMSPLDMPSLPCPPCLPSSILCNCALAWTSSGPSARRKVRLSSVGISKAVVVGYAAAAMRLNGIVYDLQRHGGCLHLDHSDLGSRCLVADLVHHVCRLQAEQTSHFNVDTGTGDAFFPETMLGNGLAECDAALQALAHFFERFFSGFR